MWTGWVNSPVPSCTLGNRSNPEFYSLRSSFTCKDPSNCFCVWTRRWWILIFISTFPLCASMSVNRMKAVTLLWQAELSGINYSPVSVPGRWVCQPPHRFPTSPWFSEHSKAADKKFWNDRFREQSQATVTLSRELKYQPGETDWNYTLLTRHFK